MVFKNEKNASKRFYYVDRESNDFASRLNK